MKSLTDFINRWPLVVYFTLAYVFAWVFFPLIATNPVLGLPALFTPALAALIVSWATGGREGARNLLKRVILWRVHFIWYLLALGIPVALSFFVSLLGRLFGGDPALEMVPIVPLAVIIFVLVVGEELGWRGYAQPALEKHFSPIVAAILLGVLWGLWHLPTFLIPGLPQSGVPFLAFVLWTVGLSVLAAWLVKHTGWSVLIATLFHGSANTFGFLTPGLDPGVYRWLLAFVYCSAALLVVLVYGPQLARSRPGHPVSTLPSSPPPES